MQTLSKWIVGVFLTISLLAPISAYAAGIPFGGLVTAVVPCHIGPAPALWVNVLGIGFIYAAGTIPFLHYVPIVGQFILGQADIPAVCFVGLVPLPGLRIQMFGTSAL